jgi:hypothetical protein
VDLDIVTKNGLLKIKVQLISQIGTSKDLIPASPAAAAENISKNVAKNIAERIAWTESATSAGPIDAGTSKLVIRGSFAIVAQNFIGFFRFLELSLGFLIVRIAIGMVFHCETTVGFLDFSRRCAALDIKYFVIVPFTH